MFDPTYPLFPIFAFLGFILALIPLPWHLQLWNSGTCFFMMWASLACLNQFVNSIVWSDNALNPAPIWCEISIRIMMGASVGLPAASLCINRRLYHISSARNVSITHSDKLRAILVDTLICVVFPLVFIALQYIIQGHRFDIFENIGCFPAFYNTLPTYFISLMWPIVVGLISAVYCALSLRSFLRRRIELGQFFSTNKALTTSRYFRLMALAASDIVLTVPLSTYILYHNATSSPIQSWISWEDTHFDYSRVEQFPAVIWRMNKSTIITLEFSRWAAPFCALVFFAFFGFADEARRNYRSVFWMATRLFGIRPTNAAAKTPFPVSSLNNSKMTSHSSPPSYSAQSVSSSYDEKIRASLTASTIPHDTVASMTILPNDTESLVSTSCDTSYSSLHSPSCVKDNSWV